MKRIVAIVLLSAACHGGNSVRTWRPATGGDPVRGARVIRAYGCGACHVIPGVRGANGSVAAPLTAFARRTFIAGELPNTPGNLVRWIRNPRDVEKATAMPALGLSERDAQDAAAYLYELR